MMIAYNPTSVCCLVSFVGSFKFFFQSSGGVPSLRDLVSWAPSSFIYSTYLSLEAFNLSAKASAILIL
jgi:hypothetical protein